MASSNRHWPSMFKSKPCNSHHEWQHDRSSSPISSNGCQRTAPYASSGCEERSPDPKPRWNPRPEQIRILEAIFDSGMVNPPRDEIRKIRNQLQEYGQVGDANVFYWFQNRKSRSKHKQRHVHSTNRLSQPPAQIPLITSSTGPTTKTALSSSSSSEKSSSQNSVDKTLSLGSKNVLEASSSSSASVNQPFFHPQSDFLSLPFFFPGQRQPTPLPPTMGSTSTGLRSQGLSFPDAPNVSHAADSGTIQNSTSLLLSDLLLMNHAPSKKLDEDKINKFQDPVSGYTVNTSPSVGQSLSFHTNVTALSSLDHNIPGGIGVGPTKWTVFINDVAFEVTSGPFNVREAFGDDAVLLHSSGQLVLTNEWGVTLHPLQYAASYYVIRTSTSSPHDATIDLI